MKVSKFFEVDFCNYSSYDNYRKIASCIDGQKVTARKILWTVLKNNIKNPIKVSQLSAKMSEEMEYLHGNCDGVVVNLCINYPGSNNLNLLKPEGTFGTRLVPEAAASRYIYTCMESYFREIFKPEDDKILEIQKFEGKDIEPKYLLPTLPLILINGSEAISTGFAQKILPRKIENIKEAIKKYLKTGKIDSKLLVPYWNGFNGKIKQGENNNQWIIEGKYKVKEEKTSNRSNARTIYKIEINEIPITYDLMSFLKLLNKLSDEDKIQTYSDLSSENQFKFLVWMNENQYKKYGKNLIEFLGLRRTISENYTCLDENNKVKEFNSVEEVFEYYLKFRLKKYEDRKKSMLNEYEKELEYLMSMYKFIQKVINDEIKVYKQKEESIIKQIRKYPKEIKPINESFDYLLRIPIKNFTKEKVEELKNQIKNIVNEVKELKKKNIKEIWKEDLKQLK